MSDARLQIGFDLIEELDKVVEAHAKVAYAEGIAVASAFFSRPKYASLTREERREITHHAFFEVEPVNIYRETKESWRESEADLCDAVFELIESQTKVTA